MEDETEELAKAILALLSTERILARRQGFIKHYSSLCGTSSERLKAALWWLYGKGYARGRGGGGVIEIYATEQGKDYARSHTASYNLLSIIDKKYGKIEKSRAKEEWEKLADETIRQLNKNDLRALLGKSRALPSKRQRSGIDYF